MSCLIALELNLNHSRYPTLDYDKNTTLSSDKHTLTQTDTNKQQITTTKCENKFQIEQTPFFQTTYVCDGVSATSVTKV